VEPFSGTVSLPIISANGSIAFLKNEDKTKFTSKNHIFLVNIADNSIPKEIVLHSGVDTEDVWPLSPEMLTWSNDESKLFVSASDTGRGNTFEISIRTGATAENSKNIPILLDIGDGSATSVHRYSSSPSDRQLLVSKTSLVESSVFLVVDPFAKSLKVLSTLADCKNLGLHRGQISEVWFKGHGDYQVHSWMIKPSYFKEGEKYPLALLIHGGPLSSWQDGWSTRWNPVLFAEQGYIVVTPDVTGRQLIYVSFSPTTF
jgi:dipeptidyl aminopeptidase/acylaminoacyl peptidase